MRVVALVSGGKDSCYAIYQCLAHGHVVEAVATLVPPRASVDEIDSHMYQTIGHQHVHLIAQCLGIPFYTRAIVGSSLCQSLDYHSTDGDEIEDLHQLLSEIKVRHPTIDAVCSGAIESNYQRLRVESVASRLALTSLAYLWRRPQRQLLQSMIDDSLHAVLVKVASAGLNKTHINQTLASMLPHLVSLNELHSANECGEGGEFESFTLDAPMFASRIVLDDWEVVTERGDIDPVSVMRINKAHIEPKTETTTINPCLNCSLTDGTQLLPLTGRSASPAVLPVGLFPVSRANGDLMFVSNMATIRHRTVTDALQSLLECSQSHPQLLYLSLLLPDMTDFAAMNNDYVGLIPLSSPPSRATIQSAVPFMTGDLLSVANIRANDRRVLHVQSISEWAPACIGPYSQSTELLGLVLVAGQIPLQPCTMKLRTDDDGLMLAWRHINAILATQQCDWSNIVHSIIYVDSRCRDRLSVIVDHANTALTSNSLRHSTMFVSAESLPRSSVVEIQSMAINTRKMNGRVRYASNDRGTHVTYIAMTFASILIALTNDSVNSDLSSAITDFHSGLSFALSASQLSLSQLWFVRIYYDYRSVDILSFERALFDSWSDTSDRPAVSFLPVDGVSSDGFDTSTGQMMAHLVVWELEDE